MAARGSLAAIPVPGAAFALVGALLWLLPAACGGVEARNGGQAMDEEPGAAGDPATRDADAAAQDADVARAAAQEAAPNALTEAEREAGWRLLFDGRTTAGWRGYRQEGMPEGWIVEDGALHRDARAGDIITEDEFEDFELSLEWKVGPAGNSGVFYLATEEPEAIYEVAPEMQVLDDAGHPNGESPLTSAGALYDLYPVPEGVVRPAGEWNGARIVVEDGRVEHWLNGTKVVEYELGSEEWERRVANSKFAEWPGYGRAERGHIGLQDHGDPVWFRSIKIREIR